jgi:general secretion pathway protein D
MLRHRRLARAIYVLSLMALPCVLIAQEADEDAVIVAEELSLQEALEGDLIIEEIDDISFDDDFELDPDLPRADIAALDDLDLDEPESVEELMDLDDPLDDPLFEELSDVPAEDFIDEAIADDGLGDLDFDAPAAEEDMLGDLGLEDIVAEAVPAEDEEMFFEEDLLGDLDIEGVQPEQVNAGIAEVEEDFLGDLDVEEAIPAQPVEGREDVVGVEEGLLDKGVPADLLGEEMAIEDAAADAAPAVNDGDLFSDALFEDALESAEEPALEAEEIALVPADLLVDEEMAIEDAAADAAPAVDDGDLFSDALFEDALESAEEPALEAEEIALEPAAGADDLPIETIDEDFDLPDFEDPAADADMPAAESDADLDFPDFGDDLFAEPASKPVAEPVAEPAVDQGVEPVEADMFGSDPFGDELGEAGEPGRAVMPDANGAVAAMPDANGAVAAMPAAMQAHVELLRESEELRRKAFRLHAEDRIAAAELEYENRDFPRAIEIFEEARRALSTLGYLPDARRKLLYIRNRITECKYQHATLLTKYNVYEEAIKYAKEATLEGHVKAPRLVEILQKRLSGKVEIIEAPKRRWRTDEYRIKQNDIRERLRTGRDYFVAQEFKEALRAFEGVLSVSPENTEAIRWREKVSQTINDRARMELESTRDDMMRMVSQTWNPRDYGADEAGKNVTTDPGRSRKDNVHKMARKKILDKMERIRIPEVDFRQANIHDVMGFLQEQSVEHDDQALIPEERGVNIILNISSLEGAAEAAAPSDDFGFDFGDGGGDGGAAASGVPSITFRARNISLLEAMNLVTEIGKLKYRIQGSVVLVIPMDDPGGEIIHRTYSVQPTISATILDADADLAGPRAAGGSGGFIPLDGGGAGGGDATDWKGFFGRLGVTWPRGSSIQYISSIGKLLVANTAENLTVFEEKLADLDVVPRQIEIEARFVEIGQSDLNSFGLEYNLTDDWEVAQKKNANGPVGSAEKIVVPKTSLTKGNRFLDEISNTVFEFARPDDLLSFASVLTNPELEIVLHAIQAKGNADLLSAPKVTTQNGLEATIKVVTEYIYPSDYTIEPGTPSTLNADGSVQQAGQPPVVTPAGFETREVGVILSVLPEVSPEGQMINLTMTPEVVTEPDWRDYGQEYTDANGNVVRIPIEQPFFHTRSISTSIMIYNGATVVMGGMISEERIEVDDRVPFLGDIPIIGRLFRSTFENSEKRNLLIFVTARLVDPRGRAVGDHDSVAELFTQKAKDEAAKSASGLVDLP